MKIVISTSIEDLANFIAWVKVIRSDLEVSSSNGYVVVGARVMSSSRENRHYDTVGSRGSNTPPGHLTKCDPGPLSRSIVHSLYYTLRY